MAQIKTTGAPRPAGRRRQAQSPTRRPLPVRQRRRPMPETAAPPIAAEAANASSGDVKSYQVGRGYPPKEYQFKPGQSGYPQGRPKGSKNVSTYIDEALATRVGGNGGSRRIPLAKVIGTRIVADAAKGSIRHQQMLVDREKARAARAEGADRPKGPPMSPEEMEAADRKIVEEFIRMVREGMAEPTGEDEPQEGRP
ncbi:MAG: DUF5681 domain-containing protein [Rhodospirillales bacterium]|nr:DUF5681 domain-containing protein [Rhodospirillales bacterium]